MNILKNIVFLIFTLVSIGALGQTFKERVPQKKWILVNDKIDTLKILNFVPYSKEKIGLNTMIWTFKPNGQLDYDYQSAEDVEACIGVDFLDLDIDRCQWALNPISHSLTLTLKGGFASIDDFILKNEYEIKENEEGGFSLVLKKNIIKKYYN
jgi:hypothetical protein